MLKGKRKNCWRKEKDQPHCLPPEETHRRWNSALPSQQQHLALKKKKDKLLSVMAQTEKQGGRKESFEQSSSFSRVEGFATAGSEQMVRTRLSWRNLL